MFWTGRFGFPGTMSSSNQWTNLMNTYSKSSQVRMWWCIKLWLRYYQYRYIAAFILTIIWKILMCENNLKLVSFRRRPFGSADDRDAPVVRMLRWRAQAVGQCPQTGHVWTQGRRWDLVLTTLVGMLLQVTSYMSRHTCDVIYFFLKIFVIINMAVCITW